MGRGRGIGRRRFGAGVAVALVAGMAATVPAGASTSTASTVEHTKAKAHVAAPAALHAPTVTPSEVVAGGIVTVAGTKCPTNTGPTSAFVSLVSGKGALVATAAAAPAPNGSWKVSLTVPPSTKAGTYDVDSTCDEYNQEFFYPPASVTVDAATSAWTAQTPPAPTGPNGTVSDVACRAANDCTIVGSAVDGTGNLAPQAAAWDGGSFTVQTVPLPAGGSIGVLNGVACAATACVAVGHYRTKQGTQAALVERSNGSSWSPDVAPNPKGASAVVLQSVSCSGAGACAAVGTYDRSDTGTVPFSEASNGTTWTVHAMPLSNGATTGAFGSVSCSAATACLAVGGAGSQMVADAWNGSSWSAVSPPAPPSANTADLAGVSCTATGCVAVGWYDDPNGYHPISESRVGTTWTRHAIAEPVNGSNATPLDISCVNVTGCVAVGTYFNNRFANVPLVESFDGSSWAAQAAPKPVGSISTQLQAVSCVASECLATGEYNTRSHGARSFAERETGASWTVVSTPRTTGARASWLSAVACGSKTSCVAVGAYETDAALPGMLAETWNGSGWTMSTIGQGADGELKGVACAAPTSCMAVGDTTDQFYANNPVVEQWDGSTWTNLAFTVPAGYAQGSLDSVSCTGPSSCVAVGYAFDQTTFGVEPLAATWNGVKWKSVIAPAPPNAVGFAQLSSVSCAAKGQCLAVGTAFFGASIVDQLSGSTWTLVAAPSEPVGAALNAVSCTAVDSCLIVGSTYAGDQTTALADRWDGQALHDAGAATGAHGGSLASITCTSATSCAAVGDAAAYGPVLGTVLVETWNGSAWTAQRTPNLTGAVASSLSGVACPSDVRCLAVGSQERGTGVPLVESSPTG